MADRTRIVTISGQTVPVHDAAAAELDFDGTVEALRAFGRRRVLVSMATRAGEPFGSLSGILVEVHAGVPAVFDVGSSGCLILDREHFVGAARREGVLFVQNTSSTLLRIEG
jgi:hypothetical protein